MTTKQSVTTTRTSTALWITRHPMYAHSVIPELLPPRSAAVSPTRAHGHGPARGGRQRFNQTFSTDCMVPVSDSALRIPSTERFHRSTPTAL